MVRIWVRMHHWRLPSHVGDDLRVSTPARLDLLKICEHFDQVDWAHVCHVQAVEDRRLIGALISTADLSKSAIGPITRIVRRAHLILPLARLRELRGEDVSQIPRV